MKGSKKCPHCGQWSVWNHDPDERCEHCHHLLAPEAQARQQAQEERKEEEKQRFSVDFIKIDPDDHWFLRFFKRIGLGFQIVFVGLVTFFIWLIALLAA
jgi:hypothetical protein